MAALTKYIIAMRF